MERHVSIAEAKNKLPAIIHDVEKGPAVKLTRYGKPVAVLVSAREYESLCRRRGNLGTALKALRHQLESDDTGITDDDFDGLRDRSSGRDFTF